MKKYKLLQVLALTSVVAMGQLAVAGNGPGKGRAAQSTVQVSATLSYEETATLVFMREEEKLARDVYLFLFAQWGNRVFTNISDSEQSHMDSLAERLSYYQIADPVIDDTQGAFVNSDLSTAYLALTERGIQSLEEAFGAGAYIEELDILDLQRAIEESTHADMDAVYEELMRGSRNHLRAFVDQIENLGVVYEAQLMDQLAVDDIVNEPLERG